MNAYSNCNNSLSVGDIIVYNDGDNDNYYEVTTAGEVTTPIADWITANATIDIITFLFLI